MRIRKRLWAERLDRVTTRAQSSRPPHTQRISLPEPSPSYAPCPPAGSIPVRDEWSDGPNGRRRNERVPVASEAAVRRLGRFCFQLPLRDVSTAGCQVELVDPLAADDPVVTRLPGLELFPARVIWTDGKCAGMQFERPMHPAVFEQLLSRVG